MKLSQMEKAALTQGYYAALGKAFEEFALTIMRHGIKEMDADRRTLIARIQILREEYEALVPRPDS